MDAFERAQRRAEAARSWLGPALPPTTKSEGPTEVVALGFVDLVGSTAWAQTLTLRDQSLALTRFESAAWTSAVLAGGRVDQDDRRRGLLRRPDGGGRLPDRARGLPGGGRGRRPARRPAGRSGIGPATPREGDYFGPLVNLLSRLVKAGAPGEVVVTEAVAGRLAAGEWVLRPLEPAELRGIEEPVRAFIVDTASARLSHPEHSRVSVNTRDSRGVNTPLSSHGHA